MAISNNEGLAKIGASGRRRDHHVPEEDLSRVEDGRANVSLVHVIDVPRTVSCKAPCVTGSSHRVVSRARIAAPIAFPGSS
jgi:hypothetical protein